MFKQSNPQLSTSIEEKWCEHEWLSLFWLREIEDFILNVEMHLIELGVLYIK